MEHTAPSTPPKSRLPLILLGCGCAAILAFAAFVALLVGGVLYATQAPFDAAHAHVQRVQQGDVSGAYGGLTAALQAELGEDGFATFSEAWPVLYGKDAEWTVSNRSVNGDRATMIGTSERDGQRAEVTIHLGYEDGAWRVSGVNIEPK
ncbi:MAG: hypothetical protein R3F62_12470 [Planctomycetota bacterium]